MFFDTPVYLLFLFVVVAIYWRLARLGQNKLLLIASYFFYGWWDWRFLGLILLSTVVDFFCAHKIEQSSNHNTRKLVMAFSVGVNIAFLGFFKYFNFFTDSFAEMMSFFGVSVNRQIIEIVLPPGISFYTFQALAYIVDVYFRRITPAKSIIDYALFISLFPHLIAGPIQQPSHLLPQVQTERKYNPDYFLNGILLIAFGLFQKCVVADNCALIADAAFSGKLGAPGFYSNMIGIYAFAWQIYGDFAGYSNIARGSAQLLGFHFMVNFRQPYLAVGLQDFWRRWHISLSTWLRDYLYISLGGNRLGTLKAHRNITLTMLIGGFWHGANWTFIIWGFLHGLGQNIEKLFRDAKPQNGKLESSVRGNDLLLGGVREWLRRWWGRILTFHLVCFAWVFFRAQSVAEAFQYIEDIAIFSWIDEYYSALVFLVMFSGLMFIIDILIEKRNEEFPFEKSSNLIKVFAGLMLTVATIFFAGSKSNAFIYFQF